MAYGDQLRAKHERLARALADYPSLAALAVPAVIGSPRLFGYRNQAKLVARRAGRGVLLGVYRPGTHQVIDVSACPVHHPAINAVLASVREAVERQRAPLFDERTGSGWLRYVVVRSSAWKRTAQVILVVRDRDWPGERELVRRVQRARGVSSVVLNVNPSAGNVIFGDRFIAGTRSGNLPERIGGIILTSSPGAFLQANLGSARRIYERVLRWADPGPEETAVDLYAGVGAITFQLAAGARLVIGIEESPIAAADAMRNVRLNGYHNVRIIAAGAAAGLTQVAQQRTAIDLLTLNPPRKGADAACRGAIVASAPARVVYVSCDPHTLARDLDWFTAHGYRVDALQPFDLLPQTEHVETVALLRRASLHV
jgi:23S rRNA (uracil1939-C5)-methyltransferase